MMFICEYLPLFSGHAIYLSRLMPMILQRGMDVEVLTFDFGTLPSTESVGGIKVNRIQHDPTKCWAEKIQTIKVVKWMYFNRKEFDILHMHGHLDPYGIICTFARALGKAVVMQMVLMGADDALTISSSGRLSRQRARALGKMVNRFIYISAAMGESYLSANFPVEKGMHIPQGVDTSTFGPVTRAEKILIRQELGLPQDKPIVAFVGAVIERKGVDVLIRAWREIQRRHPDGTLLIIGPNKFGSVDRHANELMRFVEAMKKAVMKHKLNVRFVGEVRPSMIPRYLQASDIFAFPSRKEGFGNVILEAMACGIPPVITFMDGVSKETVAHAETGLVVKNTAELVNAICRLIEDGRLRKNLGENAYQVVKRKFSLEAIASRYVEIYKGLPRGGPNA